MKIGVYPGSFDPITNGHLDIVKRASKVFDKLIILVSINASKKYMFSHDERVAMISEVTKDYKNVEVQKLDSLLVDFVSKLEHSVVIKGLRTATDFEYEFQMALLNNTLNKDVETLFMMTSSEFSYVSSSMVKEVNYFGGEISHMVPLHVANKIKEKRG